MLKVTRPPLSILSGCHRQHGTAIVPPASFIEELADEERGGYCHMLSRCFISLKLRLWVTSLCEFKAQAARSIAMYSLVSTSTPTVEYKMIRGLFQAVDKYVTPFMSRETKVAWH